jgi:hypothetical protein
MDGTKNIFLTQKQFDALKPKLGQEIEINAQFVSEAKWTKFRIYKLIDN